MLIILLWIQPSRCKIACVQQLRSFTSIDFVLLAADIAIVAPQPNVPVTISRSELSGCQEPPHVANVGGAVGKGAGICSGFAIDGTKRSHLARAKRGRSRRRSEMNISE